jgi:hypothetical protein
MEPEEAAPVGAPPATPAEAGAERETHVAAEPPEESPEPPAERKAPLSEPEREKP